MTSEETTQAVQAALCKWCFQPLDGETIEVLIASDGTHVAFCSDGCVDDFEVNLRLGLFRLVAGGA